MRITIAHNAAQVSREVQRIAKKEWPFFASRAINHTVLEVQTALRAGTHERFIVRRRQWMDRAYKIKPFATKRSLRAVIAVNPPGGQERADILTKFEDGGTKTPKGRRLAVPDAARARPQQVIPRSRRPKAFGFQLHGSGPKATVYKGAKRAFMVLKPDGTGGIYQRTGRRKGKGRGRAARRLASDIATRKVRDLMVKTLYRFTPEATIDSRLKFEETVVNVVKVSLPRTLADAHDRAIAAGRSRVAGRIDGRDVIVASPGARRIARTDVYR